MLYPKKFSVNLILVMALIAVVTAGCVSELGTTAKNETVTTPVATDTSVTYNETKLLKINDTFETWSRGYVSNSSYKQTYFIVVTNYSAWTAFLEEQGYKRIRWTFEGELYPGINTMPRTIISADFNDYFIIAAMMGYQGIRGPEIEIKNISRINSTINVTVRMYKPSSGGAVVTSPYHIVIVKEEILPTGNSTFVFIDTEGKEIGKLEMQKRGG